MSFFWVGLREVICFWVLWEGEVWLFFKVGRSWFFWSVFQGIISLVVRDGVVGETGGFIFIF
jgi:hypothetical protein